MKISKKTAFALIRAWQAGARLCRMSDDILDELKTKLGDVHFNMFVRTFIGTQAKQVSDLCFSNKFQSAAIMLMQTGFDPRRSAYESDLQNIRNQTNRYISRKKKDAAECVAKHEAHKRSCQWSVCK